MSIKKTVIDLDNQGLILIKGDNQDSSEYRSNGAGKSTIMEGISIALFEKTIRGLSPNECINDEIGKGLCVTLDFDGDDGHSYRITRHRRDGSFKNDTVLFQDKHNITPKSNRDCNKLIESIVQMDFLTFTNSILFGQGILKTFSMATDAEKKLILERILKLDIWSKALDVAKEQRKDKKDELTKVDYEIENKGNLIDSKQGSIQPLLSKAEEEKESIKNEIADLKQEILDEENANQEKLSQLKEQLNKEQNDLASLLPEDNNPELMNGIESSLQDVNNQLVELKEFEKEARKNTAAEADARAFLNSISRDITKMQKEYKDIKSGVGSKCPVCKQDITEEGIEDSLSHIVSEGKRLRKKEETAKKALVDVVSAGETLQKSLANKDKIESARDDINRKIYQFKAEIESSKRQRKMIEQNIQRLKDDIQDVLQGQSVRRLKNELKKLEINIDQNHYQDIIKQICEEVRKLKKEQEELTLNRADLKEDMDNLDFAVSAFGNSGIKSYVLDTVTPYLNKQANYYSAKLTGGTTEIEFKTQVKLASGEYRDKFDVQIHNCVGGKSYISNSTGERKRVDLAISLALQDLVMSRSSSKFNLLLYDECFDGLDDIGCENAIELLQEMQDKIPSIFVITHNDTLKSFFEHTLLVTKKDGETKVKKVE